MSAGTVIVEDPVAASGVEVPKRLDDIDAKLSFKYEPVHYTIEIAHVSFRAADPSFGLNSLSGTIALRDVAVSGAEEIPNFDGLSADVALEGDRVLLPETRFSLGGSPLSIRATGRNLAQPVIEFEARAAQLEPPQ